MIFLHYYQYCWLAQLCPTVGPSWNWLSLTWGQLLVEATLQSLSCLATKTFLCIYNTAAFHTCYLSVPSASAAPGSSLLLKIPSPFPDKSSFKALLIGSFRYFCLCMNSRAICFQNGTQFVVSILRNKPTDSLCKGFVCIRKLLQEQNFSKECVFSESAGIVQLGKNLLCLTGC